MIFGKYHLLEQIGNDPVSLTFTAKSTGIEGFEKLHIIRQFHSQLSQNAAFTGRFITSAEQASQLTHANITQISDMGKIGEWYFLASDYVNGENLKTILETCEKTNTPFSEDLALFVYAELAKGLKYAHAFSESTRLSHGNICRRNIFISYEGEVKIHSFGVPHTETPSDLTASELQQKDLQDAADVLDQMLNLATRDGDSDSAASATSIHQLLNAVRAASNLGNSTQHPADLVTEFCYTQGIRIGEHTLATFMQRIKPSISKHSPRPRTSVVPRQSNVSSLLPDLDLPDTYDGTDMPPVRLLLIDRIKDISLLALSSDETITEADTLAVDIMLKKLGATPLDSSGLYAFALKHHCDAIVNAATAAVRIAEYLQTKDRQFGIGISLASLRIRNDKIVENKAFEDSCRDAYSLAKSAPRIILFKGELSDSISRKLSFAPHIDGIVEVRGITPRQDQSNPLFVNRDLLTPIVALLSEVHAGHGRLLIMTGRAGSGKSSLFQQIKLQLDKSDNPMRWHQTACLPWNKEIPYATLRALLVSVLQAADDESASLPHNVPLENGLPFQLPDTLTSQLSEGEQVAVQKMQQQKPLNATDKRFLASAFSEIVYPAADNHPMVLFLDNLSYIDDASLEVLHHLAHTMGDKRIFLCMAIEPGYIHGFEHSELCTQMHASSLNKDQLYKLVDATAQKKLPTHIKDRIGVKSDNNPSYSTSYMETLISSGHLKVEADSVCFTAPLEMPPPGLSLRLLTDLELSHLQDDELATFRLCTLLEDPIDLTLLDHCLGLSPTRIRIVLDKLCEMELLAQTESDEYVFTTPCMQPAVRSSIPMENQRNIYREIISILTDELADSTRDSAQLLATAYRMVGTPTNALPFIDEALEQRLTQFDYKQAARLALYKVEQLLLIVDTPEEALTRALDQFVDTAMQTGYCRWLIGQMERLYDIPRYTTSKTSAGLVDIARAHLLAHEGQTDEAVSLAQEIEDKCDAGLVRCKVNLLRSVIFITTGHILAAKDALEAAESEARLPENKVLAEAYRAVKSAMAANTEQAHLYQKKLEATMQTYTWQGMKGVARSLYERSISLILAEEEQLEGALKTSMQAAGQLEKAGNIKQAASHFLDVADIRLRQNEFKEAFDAVRKADTIAAAISFAPLEEMTRIYLSYIDAAKFDSEDGLANLIRRNEMASSDLHKAQSALFLHDAFKRRKQFFKARKYVKMALKHIEMSGNKHLLKSINA